MTRPTMSWSREDDDALIHARALGMTYAEIQADIFPHRTHLSIEKRGKRLIHAGKMERHRYEQRDDESVRDDSFDKMVRAGSAALLSRLIKFHGVVA